MKLVIDGVFFQLAQSGIARVWTSIIPLLARRGDISITVLDRGGLPPLNGVRVMPFPGYRLGFSADDSLLLQRMCGFLEADVFMSTYYTTPLTVPSVLVIHDMIPERLGFDLSARAWQEKETAILFARTIVCVSHHTRDDLLDIYAGLATPSVVAHNGVDHSVFRPAPSNQISRFRQAHALTRDYLLLVGSREQYMGYKNAGLFFRSISGLGRTDFDILCVGGEPEIDPEHLAALPRGVTAKRIELSDEELAVAYSGATALVYPSRYEGFGMPVVEAMACGCPVVTTANSSLIEVAGNAALIVDSESVDDMQRAIRSVSEPETRETLRRAGLERAKAFSWTTLADAVADAVLSIGARSTAGEFDGFFRDWSSVRKIQASVDTALVGPA